MSAHDGPSSAGDDLSAGQRDVARQSTRLRAAAALGAAALVLTSSACGGVTLRDPTEKVVEEKVGDPPTTVYYRAGSLDTTQAVVDARLPRLAGGEAHWVEGQFTDPGDRVPMPAQDDYWWQAVVRVSPAKAREFIRGTSPAQVPPESGTDGVLTDAQVRAQIVRPLQGPAGTCNDHWRAVTVGNPEKPEYTVQGGDYISVAAACEATGVVVVSTHDT